jgi:hypothetical protein
MPRPLLVELRLRKPCCRLRRIFEGWYCRFMSVSQSKIVPARTLKKPRTVKALRVFPREARE